MPANLEVLFTPAEFAALANRDLSQTACVVFDVLRATSSIVTALGNGAASVIPVAEIPDALAIRQRRPDVLLAGEREGRRIPASLAGGIEFDLGNSPREFIPARVSGKTIVLSTTNGSRALRACARAQIVLVGAFLNLHATADYLKSLPSKNLLLVCSGTFEEAAYEDILGAGAMADLAWPRFATGRIADSATVAVQLHRQFQSNLMGAMQHSRNARRLLEIQELRDDVPWCLQRDLCPLIAKMEDGEITKFEA